MPTPLPAQADGLDWERLWAPYDDSTYQEVLQALEPRDTVLEIGAGDLRLARRMAARTAAVFAVENQKHLLVSALDSSPDSFPDNLIPLWGDARRMPFPHGITVGVLLMRHCTTFGLYYHKLRAAGARRMITNARWRLGVEVIDLNSPRTAFEEIGCGWYACQCGHTGFVPGPVERITAALWESVFEITGCPACPAASDPPETASGSSPRWLPVKS